MDTESMMRLVRPDSQGKIIFGIKDDDFDYAGWATRVEETRKAACEASENREAFEG